MNKCFSIIACFLVLTIKPSPAIVDFPLLTVEGVQSGLYSELERGRIVVLYCFSTQCGYCAMTTPVIVDLKRQYDSLGLDCIQIIGIGTHAGDLEEYILEHSINFTVCDRLQNDSAFNVLVSHGGVGFPNMTVINPDGSAGLTMVGYTNVVDNLDTMVQAAHQIFGCGNRYVFTRPGYSDKAFSAPVPYGEPFFAPVNYDLRGRRLPSIIKDQLIYLIPEIKIQRIP